MGTAQSTPSDDSVWYALSAYSVLSLYPVSSQQPPKMREFGHGDGAPDTTCYSFVNCAEGQVIRL